MTDEILIAGDKGRSDEIVRLEERDLLGEGGEGRVFRLPHGRAAKILTAPTPEREAKLRAFAALPSLPDRVTAPLALCFEPPSRARGASPSRVVGYVMRALENAIDLSRLGQRGFREAAKITNEDVLTVFRALSKTIADLHARGIVVGDLNDGNVMLVASALRRTAYLPWLIDVDSMQFGGHLCVVAHERYLDPRLYSVDLKAGPALTAASDHYALAVLLFSSLLYVHPFGGTHASFPTILRRAEARVSALRSDVKLPKTAARLDVLDDDALAWLLDVFEKDKREPLPSSLLEMRFTRCSSCGLDYAEARRACPACKVTTLARPLGPGAATTRSHGRIRVTRVFVTPPGGRLVAVALQNGLKHVHEDAEGRLVREDGTVVRILSTAERHAHRRVRIAHSSTWVGSSATGRFERIVAGNVLESHPVMTVRAATGDLELAADAGEFGLVSIDGDSLMRASGGTRIGQVLEGKTHVRAGATIGFCFYRAGGVTVAFVFDPRRGVLRQIESMPPIEGKLVDWSACFDDNASQVLVTFVTEAGGHVACTVHAIDKNGVVLGSDHARNLDYRTPFGTSLTGRAIANGNVIVSTEGNLRLLRTDPQTRSFVLAREFPEARDLVGPEDDILVGPGGSLYVITRNTTENADEIHHLCFTES